MGEGLEAHRRKGRAQYGEDGVIEEIFRRLGEGRRFAVEFGAGSTASSTAALIERGWSALLIEADPALARGLAENFAGNSRVATLRARVAPEGENRLDAILARHGVPADFDFLVIDIDGGDYHVWKALAEYRPRVVMIEYNGRIPFDISFIEPRGGKVPAGSSLRAIADLGKEKGYALAHAHAANAIFVAREFFPALDVPERPLEEIAEPLFPRARFFELYDGSVVLTGIPYGRLLAHKKKVRGSPVYLLEEGRLRPVPFVRDRAPLRLLKNLLKASPLRPLLAAAARRFYGRRRFP